MKMVKVELKRVAISLLLLQLLLSLAFAEVEIEYSPIISYLRGLSGILIPVLIAFMITALIFPFVIRRNILIGSGLAIFAFFAILISFFLFSELVLFLVSFATEFLFLFMILALIYISHEAFRGSFGRIAAGIVLIMMAGYAGYFKAPFILFLAPWLFLWGVGLIFWGFISMLLPAKVRRRRVVVER
jgi:hypothetical protein